MGKRLVSDIKSCHLTSCTVHQSNLIWNCIIWDRGRLEHVMKLFMIVIELIK